MITMVKLSELRTEAESRMINPDELPALTT